MIVRLWKTGVEPTRVGEYEEFAREISLPMFRAQEGFLGVLLARSDPDFVVVSFWRDINAVNALDESPTYRETVERISRTGFLTGNQRVEVLHLTGGELAQGLIDGVERLGRI